jgi:hypothetical protein
VAAVDQLGAHGQIDRVDQPGGRHRHEIGIGHIERAVGEGQPAGLGKQMDRIDRQRRLSGQPEMLQQAEDLKYGQTAGTRRAGAAHPVFAIGTADWLAHRDAVTRQIAFGQSAGIVGDLMHRPDHVPGDRAVVEGVGALIGNGAQHLGIGWVAQDGAFRQRCAVGTQEIGGGGGVAAQVVRVLRDVAGQQGGNREAPLGQGDGRLEQVGPG